MTSEVAILNRSAVALAADSATTVSYWESGQKKQRYFKGANKIFHLSAKHPVGLMIYGSGTLQGVPWEVLAKAYRDARGSQGQPKLKDYPGSLFEFLACHNEIYPPNWQEEQATSGLADAATNIAFRVFFDDRMTSEENEEARKALATELFDVIKTEVQNAKFICPDCEAFAAEALAKHGASARDQLTNNDSIKEILAYFNPQELIEVGALAFLKEKFTPLQNTGLVFAGFGSSEFFPQLEHYECFGVLMGKFLCRPVDEDSRSITFDNVSDIVSVAQDEMVNTFVYGANLRALARIDWNFGVALNEFGNALVKAGHLQAQTGLEDIKNRLKGEFANKTKRYMWEQHTIPLKRAIGMLPVAELADLAETLVLIESLKERVTRESESVSGPIDVAVISKGDGFIWIKRKHYFKPDLNVRYMAKKKLEQAED